MRYLIFAILSIALINPVLADNHLVETRFCGEPKRDQHGNIEPIEPNQYVVNAFKALHPLPLGWIEQDWEVDFVIPPEVGGCHAVSNMQWLPVSIKSCSEYNCKIHWERHLYQE